MSNIRVTLKGSAKKRQNKTKSTLPPGMVTMVATLGWVGEQEGQDFCETRKQLKSPLPNAPKFNSNNVKEEWGKN